MKKYFKTLKIDAGLLDDLKVLKGIYGSKNMSETIRRLMKHGGYGEEFFDEMERLKEARK